ncbi:MAG: DUF6786 family protein [Bacteroides uniformis]
MTTSASGDEGDSYGWINYRFIREEKVSPQFNPVGGEERFRVKSRRRPVLALF